MNKIYIEAKKPSTSEYVFLETLLNNIFGQEWKDRVEIICADGKDHFEALVPQMKDCTEQEGKNLVIFDADFEDNQGGFQKRQIELLQKREDLGISFELFLFPNNHDDGDVEACFEMMMLPQHIRIMECFNDFEVCLGPDYLHPNRKGRCHTYISSMPMSKTKHDRLGTGQWQFDNPEYWDINASGLQPLRDFLIEHLS
mgnify:FL=1